MSPLNIDKAQLDRYSRQIIMDEIGTAGQQQLLDSRVLVIGAGGLGSPIIQYLAASGVGTLGIVDDDVVERSNLQRQIIHGESDIGQPKVESASDFVSDLNPGINVETHNTRLDRTNVEAIVRDYDVIVDGSDNFETRYIVNDACTLIGRPLSHGAILRFEGQITTFEANDTSPCYRCLFPKAPPSGEVPNCATAGVLGVLPGTIGCLQATESIKLILEKGDSLDSHFLCYDAMEMIFDKSKIQPNPDCKLCGTDISFSSIDDIEYADRYAIGN